MFSVKMDHRSFPSSIGMLMEILNLGPLKLANICVSLVSKDRLGVPQRLVFFCFVGMTWAIWKNRDEMAIEKKSISNLDVVIYASISISCKYG